MPDRWMTTVGTAVPVTAFFGLLYLLFDRYLWKWSMFRRVLLVPDLNGVWECRGRTALKNGTPVELTGKEAYAFFDRGIGKLEATGSGALPALAAVLEHHAIRLVR